MNITFRVGETPRVYVERINIQGNTVTRDKVIRREFRLNEGDAFNAFKVKRSQDRIQSLGFFQENLEIKQAQGSSNDRVVLNVDVEEKSTGELQLSAGYSSLEQFILSASVAQRNFMGKGQQLQTPASTIRAIRSRFQLGFTEPLLFRQEHPAGRRNLLPRLQQLQLRSVTNATQTYGADSARRRCPARLPGHRICQLRHALLAGRRTISRSTRICSSRTFRQRRPTDEVCEPAACRPLSLRRTRQAPDLVGRLFDVLTTIPTASAPTRGQRIMLGQDFAGLGGDVKYIRTRARRDQIFRASGGFRPLGPRRGRLYPSAAGSAGRRAGSDPPHRPLLRSRRCAALTSAASAPASCARPYESPTELDDRRQECRQRRTWRAGLLYGPA